VSVAVRPPDGSHCWTATTCWPSARWTASVGGWLNRVDRRSSPSLANLGLRRGLADHGIMVHETDVGERESSGGARQRRAWSLGGEQSGHIVFPEFATTGDCLLTVGRFWSQWLRGGAGRTIGDMACRVVSRAPQVLESIPVSGERCCRCGRCRRPDPRGGGSPRLEWACAGETLRDRAVVRVMVEAVDAGTAEAVAEGSVWP
jgi:phosphoglucosamine mutase